MPLDRHSRIRDAWQNPVARDMIAGLFWQLGRSTGWMESAFSAAPLAALDRFGGPGFADFILQAAAYAEKQPACAKAPGTAGHGWWRDAVIYQIYLPSFMDSDHDGVGDIAGLLQRLPYLAGLGTDTLLIWPALEAADAAGRAARSHRRLGAEAGTEDDFARLVTQAHRHGMRVIMGLDILATAEDHPWFGRALARNGFENFYTLVPGRPDAPPNNWGRAPAGTAWQWYPHHGRWGLRTTGRQRMDLNWNNPHVRDEMAAVLRYWAGMGADGFWLGSANLICKAALEDGNPAGAAVTGFFGSEHFTVSPRLPGYLRQLHDSLPKELLLMGETRFIGPGAASQLAACGGLDMIADTGQLATRRRMEKKTPAAAMPAWSSSPGNEGRVSLLDLKNYYLAWMERYGHTHWMALYLETPETPRMVSRLGASAVYRPLLAKLLGALLFTLRGTPMLMQGQELGLGNTRFKTAGELRDPSTLRLYQRLREEYGEADALDRAQSQAPDHSRTPVPWSNGPRAGFTGAEPWIRLGDGADRLNVASQIDDKNSVWQFYHRLIALRRKNPCLVHGDFRPAFAKNRRVFCYFRVDDAAKWYVELNLTERTIARPGKLLGSMRPVLSNYGDPEGMLRPYEATIYLCE